MASAVIRSDVLCSQPSTNQLLGAEVSSRLVAVTVAGDGVILHDFASQALETSFALGGAGRLSFVAPAVLNVAQQACTTLVAESASGAQRLVSWPAGVTKNRQRGSKPGAGFTTIADVLQSVPVPGKGHSLHILYPPSHSLASSSTQQQQQQQHAQQQPQPSLMAVVLQDGSVGFCAPDAVQLTVLQPPSAAPTQTQETQPKLRAACSLSTTTHASLYTLHQAAAGTQVNIHEYVNGHHHKLGHTLRHSRCLEVTAPSQTALALSFHAASTYLTITWSTGDVSVVRGIGKPQSGTAPVTTTLHLTLPPHMQPSASSTSAPTTTPQTTGSKRKTPAAPTPPDLSTTPAIAAAPVDNTQVLVLKATASTTPTTLTNRTLHYALIDQQYGCTLSTGTITTLDDVPPPPAASLSSTIHRTSPIIRLYTGTAAPSGCLILQVGTTLLTITVDSPPANLLTLVGKLAVSNPAPTSARNAPVPTPAPVTATPTEVVLDTKALSVALGAGAGAFSGQDLSLTELPDTLAVSRPALSAHAVNLVTLIKRSLLPDQPPASSTTLKEAVEHLVAHLQRAQQDFTSWSLQTYLAPVTVQALAQAGQWERLAMVMQALPLQSLAGCAQVLPVVCRARQFQLLPLMCIKLDDIPAGVLVETLQVLMSTSKDADAAAQKQAYYKEIRSTAEAALAHAEQELQLCVGDSDEAVRQRRTVLALAQCAAVAVDGFTSTQVLLHAPLSTHMDAATLAGALRSLTNRQVDRLLEYLALWVHKYSNDMDVMAAMGQDLPPLPSTLLFPTYTQVLEWVRLLVDVHLPRLLMASNPPACLGKMLELVKGQVGTCRDLMPLLGALEHVRSAAPLPAASLAASSQYSVQYIDLGMSA